MAGTNVTYKTIYDPNIHTGCIKRITHAVPTDCTYICVSEISWNCINNKP